MRSLPPWVRWFIPFAVVAAAAVGLVRFVNANNTDTPPEVNLQAEAQANEEANVLIAQDQAPHRLRLRAGEKPAAAIDHAVRTDMAYQIQQDTIDGPLQSVACHATPSRAPKLAYSCTAVADNVTYPFLGVIDVPANVLTYCKRDPPPIPSENVPVSRRCLA